MRSTHSFRYTIRPNTCSPRHWIDEYDCLNWIPLYPWHYALTLHTNYPSTSKNHYDSVANTDNNNKSNATSMHLNVFCDTIAPVDTRRNNNVIFTSKRCCTYFDAKMTWSLRHVSVRWDVTITWCCKEIQTDNIPDFSRDVTRVTQTYIQANPFISLSPQ